MYTIISNNIYIISDILACSGLPFVLSGHDSSELMGHMKDSELMGHMKDASNDVKEIIDPGMEK